MEDRLVSLKPVKDLIGMNFYIADYQRGYRWEKQQAIDLLEDILSFAEEIYSQKGSNSDRIYCIQPLVVSQKDNEETILDECKKSETTLDDIKRLIKGSWTVVDGQQRLTTIYLLLTCLDVKPIFNIEYCTRKGSAEYLGDIARSPEPGPTDNSTDNIDYYHMREVYNTIEEWLNKISDKKEDKEEKLSQFKEALLNRVQFIWYQIDKSEEIAVFTRLNIGKIPLTDAELIKALFLNRTNAGVTDSSELESIYNRIALEWDQIEHNLQNDEFWLFLHDTNYSKPTRIDYIMDMIQQNDIYSLYIDESRLRRNNREQANAKNKALKERIGNDEHKVFRYFNEAFKANRESNNIEWLEKLWQEVKKYYQVFLEWYQDYRLYHYIGYLTTIEKRDKVAKLVNGLVEDWVYGVKDNKRCNGERKKVTKGQFVNHLKDIIKVQLNKREWFSDLKNEKPQWVFDEESNGEATPKTECRDFLLLHNIETIIQQNDKLVEETKYNLPNFSKFPFHLYKREKWQIEHIRPNSGDKLTNENMKRLYLSLAKEYFSDNDHLRRRIENYISGNNVDFEELLSEIYENGGTLKEEEKNKLWNFVLLDEATNKEYGNQIFPVKRAFIANKKNGIKVKYSFNDGEFGQSDSVPEVAFVPPCTENVFSKHYTQMPKTMINWNEEDARAYWKDIQEKLKFYWIEDFYNGDNI